MTACRWTARANRPALGINPVFQVLVHQDTLKHIELRLAIAQLGAQHVHRFEHIGHREIRNQRHRLFRTTDCRVRVKVEFAVTVLIIAAVMPHDGRVGIVDCHFAILRNHRLDAPRWNRHALITLDLHGQLRTNVASFRRVNAPQMAFPFTVLGILTDGNVHQSIVDNGRCNQVIARAAPAENPFGFFGVGIKLPKQSRFSVDAFVGTKAVDPAIPTRKDDLRYSPQNPDGRRRPLTMENVLTGRVISPVKFPRVLVHGHKTGSSG